MKEEITSMSSKGQVVLPASIREGIGITKGMKIAVIVKGDMIVMKPLKRLSELQGIVKGMKGKSKEIVDELRREWDIRLEAG
jgi:antitoxin PrlF